MGAGNRTQVLCKDNKCCKPLSHFSSPKIIFIIFLKDWKYNSATEILSHKHKGQGLVSIPQKQTTWEQTWGEIVTIPSTWALQNPIKTFLMSTVQLFFKKFFCHLRISNIYTKRIGSRYVEQTGINARAVLSSSNVGPSANVCLPSDSRIKRHVLPLPA